MTDTIFFPDVSHFNGVNIDKGTVAVVAKATHGHVLIDNSYPRFRQQAANVGALFVAYHWLNHGNLQAQARFCYNTVGSTPLMIDAEDVIGNTGYSGPLTVDDVYGFVDAYRALGGRVHLVYLPHWYWQDHMKSPTLQGFSDHNLHLVSSNYTKYSDDGPGWTPYGGAAPRVWQYTNAFSYGGASADFNAYKGSIDGFTQLVQGVSEVEQGDKVTGNLARGNNVGDVLADVGNLRDELYSPLGVHSKNPPPDNSRLAVMANAAEAIVDGSLTVQLELSDADLSKIANAVVSQLATVLEGLLHVAEGTH